MIAPPSTGYTNHDEATFIAAINQQDDPEWTYKVVEASPYYFIEVYDETGSLLGRL